MVIISKKEQQLYNILKKYFPKLNQQLSLGKYHYDFYLKNKIIEFNGDYWHANPDKYLFEDYVGIILNNQPTYAYEIWAKDEKKIQYAEQLGYKILIVWENNYIIEPRTTIKKCISFLLSE